MFNPYDVMRVNPLQRLVGQLKRRVVYIRRPTPVKTFVRLWLQKFIPGVILRTVLRVMARGSIVLYMSKGAGHGFNCGVYV